MKKNKKMLKYYFNIRLSATASDEESS